MKKTFISKLKYAGLAFVATVVASLSLCANVNAATTIKYDPQMTDDELRKAIVECNQISEMLSEGMFVKEVRIQGIETLNYIENVWGPNYYTYRITDWGDIFVDTQLASYGYFHQSGGKKVVRLYDDELWQFFKSHLTTGSRDEEYNPYEYYTERYMKNGMLYTRARITGNGIPMDVLKTDGVDVTRKIDYMEVLREFDPETLRIRKNIESVKYSDENDLIQFMGCTVEYFTEFPSKEKESKLYDEIFGGERHTIKIITNVGTENEREYSIAANKDTYLDYWIRNSNRKYTSYLDPACTIPVELDEDGLLKFDSDKVLYMN